MREIKFKFIVDKIHITRPYNITEILMLDEENILELMEVCTCELNESNNHCECGTEFHNSEITGQLQYTGLKDKNGKEIYEGDISKYTRRTANGSESVNVEIYFDTELLEFGMKKCNELFNGQFNYEHEIIGNIHENKYLL